MKKILLMLCMCMCMQTGLSSTGSVLDKRAAGFGIGTFLGYSGTGFLTSALGANSLWGQAKRSGWFETKDRARFSGVKAGLFAALFTGGWYSTRRVEKDWRWLIGGALLGAACNLINTADFVRDVSAADVDHQSINALRSRLFYLGGKVDGRLRKLERKKPRVM